MAVLIDLAFFVAGAALLFGFVRWWQPEMRLGLCAVHAALALLFWSPGLLSSGHQIATDFAYLTLPFRDAEVLALAYAYESATEWHRRKPAI